MFIGEFTHTLDDKGRVAVPVKLRSKLKSGAVITRGIDKCLFLYPPDQWSALAEKLAALPLSQANSRAFARLMLAGAMPVEIDAQGRMMIPDYLRDFAGLSKNIVFAGLYNRLEVWDEAAWKAYTQATEAESGAIAERMAELGV